MEPSAAQTETLSQFFDAADWRLFGQPDFARSPRPVLQPHLLARSRLANVAARAQRSQSAAELDRGAEPEGVQKHAAALQARRLLQPHW